MAACRLTGKCISKLMSNRSRVLTAHCRRSLCAFNTAPKITPHRPMLLAKRHFARTGSCLNQTTEVSYNFEVQDEDDFKKRVLASKVPVVVDFHAEWCGPCKVLGPKLVQEVDNHEGKVLLAKVDIDLLSDIAMEHKIKVVPTVIAMKNGREVQKFEGNIPEGEIKSFLLKLTME